LQRGRGRGRRHDLRSLGLGSEWEWLMVNVLGETKEEVESCDLMGLLQDVNRHGTVSDWRPRHRR